MTVGPAARSAGSPQAGPDAGGAGSDRSVTVLLLIVLIALGLRIPGLGESLWFDELFSTRLHLYSAGALFRTAAGDLHPPFHSILMFFWIRIFGDSEIAIRIPPLVFGLGSIVLTWAIGRRYASDRAALLAAFLLAVSPVHVWYSQEARHYSSGVFFALFAVYALLRVHEQPRSLRWLSSYVAGVVLLAMTHFYHVAIIGALAIIALLRGGRHARNLVRIDVAAILALATYIILKAEVAGLTMESGHLIRFTPAALWRLLDWFVTGGSVWLASPAPATAWSALRIATMGSAVVVCALGVKAIAHRSGRQAVEPVLLLFAVPVLLLAMNAVGFGRVYIERSALPALPFFLLLLALGADAIARPGRRPVIAAIVLLAIVPTIGSFLHRDQWTVYKPNPDWRSTAAYLRTYQQQREPLIVFVGTPAAALNYYGLDLSDREAAFSDVIGSPPAPPRTDTSTARGRFKLRLNTVTAYGGPDEFPPSFLRGSRHELILLREPPVDSVIAGVLARARTDRFLTLLNRFWPNEVSAALNRIGSNPAYTPVADTVFFGIEVREYRLRSRGVGERRSR